MSSCGQGSLEYLLIVAAVLAIGVTVALIASNMTSGARGSAEIDADKYACSLASVELVDYDQRYDGTNSTLPEVKYRGALHYPRMVIDPPFDIGEELCEIGTEAFSLYWDKEDLTLYVDVKTTEFKDENHDGYPDNQQGRSRLILNYTLVDDDHCKLVVKQGKNFTGEGDPGAINGEIVFDGGYPTRVKNPAFDCQNKTHNKICRTDWTECFNCSCPWELCGHATRDRFSCNGSSAAPSSGNITFSSGVTGGTDKVFFKVKGVKGRDVKATARLINQPSPYEGCGWKQNEGIYQNGQFLGEGVRNVTFGVDCPS